MIQPRIATAYSPLGLTKPAIDYPLVAAVAALCIAGVIFVFTSSAAHSWQLTNGESIAFLSNHLKRLLAGIAALVLFYHVRYQFLQKAARWALMLAVLGLVVVLLLPKLPGTSAKRWLMIFGLSVQPAEFAKYAFLAWASGRLAEIDESSFPSDRAKKLKNLFIVAALTLALVIVEPNLSMVILIGGMLLVLLLLHGLAWKKILLMIPLGVAGAGIMILIKPYMVDRIRAFLDGIANPLNASYHVKQSLIAVGQGGVLGLGLGQSTQKHYYLPEPYNDSIFSIIGEEAGIVGTFLLLSAFLVLAVRGWKIAMNAQDRFSYYLAAGITASVVCSMIINVGVNLALLPATGQPLPFVSYGGTSLVMSLAAVGILLNIAKQQNTSLKWQGSPRPLNY